MVFYQGTSGDDFYVQNDPVQSSGVYGAEGNDTLISAVGSNILRGAEDNDVLLVKSNSLPNTLFGDDGNDRIRGGDGNDYLWGGDGFDRVRGGAGVDSFRINTENSFDVITDFDSDIETIRLQQLEEPFDFVLGNKSETNTLTVLFHNERLAVDYDGTGSQAPVIFARLKGVDSLSEANFY